MIVPVFAVERTQELLDDIAQLKQDHELPSATIFLDSPLAERATEVFYRHRQALEGKEGPAFTDQPHPRGAIMPAGSGMWVKDHLWRPDSTVPFAGYRTPGTWGAIIRTGAYRLSKRPVAGDAGEGVAAGT